VLKPGGICVLAGIGGSGLHEEALSRVVGVLTASVRSKFADEKFVSFGVDFSNKDLVILRDLAESGKMIPTVTKIYPLTETAAAYKYLETGHVQGKIAITVE
jgi:NADPH:quinone reductase-like Zn-dependent oxidoreductase